MAIVVWLILAEWLYVRALRVLGRRGVRVPRGQVACWHVGLGLQAIALLSPLGSLADDLLSAHMAEHLLLADLGAPLLLAGLRNPVLAFFLPRDVLVAVARRRRLRAVFRWLRLPYVAIPVYVVVLYGWHLSFAFEGAVRHELVVGAGAEAAAAARRPVEDRPHLRRPDARHVPRDGLRADPHAGLHRRLRERRAARDQRAGRPADGGRDDGGARHPHHGLRSRVLLLARRAAVRPRRGGGAGARRGGRPCGGRPARPERLRRAGARGRPAQLDRLRRAGARRYLTVSLPSMPAARWPSTEQ